MTAGRIGTVAVLALTTALLGAVAVGTDRLLSAVLAAVAAVCGLALALRADRYESTMEVLGDVGERALTLAPGALIVYFAFNGGGYFPGSQGFIALLLAIVLALRMWLASEPLAGFGPLSLMAAGLLTLYALWIGLSAQWSHAPGRAVVELDRVILYLLAFVLFASFASNTERMRLMMRGLAAGVLLVCSIGLVTRVAPDLWPIAADLQQGRLSYPLTYWNAFGLLAALGLIWSTHLTSAETEPAPVRVLGAAAMPVIGTALFFTFSRGGMAVAILGLVAYALLARPRGLLCGLLAGAPATAIAIVVAYHADLLASDNPTSTAAAAQGHRVALAVGLCAVGAGLVRLALVRVDALFARLKLPSRMRRIVPAAAWTAGVVVAVAVFLGLSGPHRVSANYHRFVHGNAVVISGDLRSRLGDPGNNRRIDQWNVALNGYRDDRFRGLGAGTYENLWNERRPVRFAIRDAHSLYFEVLAELGTVGIVLLAIPLGMILFALARGLWGRRERYVYAALLASAFAWLIHAGLDWDWEMPAATVWLFCVGGAALAAGTREINRRLRLRRAVRFGLALVFLAIAVVPAALTVSERRLNEARSALARGDCPRAETEARRSLDVIGFRPEPSETIALCAARRGALPEAEAAARETVSRDPGNWRYRYLLALVVAAGGGDGMPAARTAAALNPRDPTAAGAPAVLRGPAAETRARTLLSGGG